MTFFPFPVMADKDPPSPKREDEILLALEIAGQARNDG